MNLQEELKALKERIAELEERAKGEQEFPQVGDEYWRIDDKGSVDNSLYNDYYTDNNRQSIGNFFQTEQQAEFIVEKLKVEAELRKYGRPFKEDENNYYIELCPFDKTLSINSSDYFKTQGTVYFESMEIANESIITIGTDRIKKYIFEVED